MSREKLKYLSTNTLDYLVEHVYENLPYYREGNFNALIDEGGWDIPLDFETDLTPLSGLDPSGTPEAEVSNSILVWQCLYDLSPALACENRIWTRLSHVECLDYSRARWRIPADDAMAAKSIRKHMFAPTLNACRDDHSISRLWWNARIAKLLQPEDQKGALALFLGKADFRLNFIERSRLASRPVIGRAVLRALKGDPWMRDPDNFKGTMKALNFLGSGIVFELYTEAQMDEFIISCRNRAEQEALKKAA